MPRAKSNLDDTVSLFPFLSILACIIGILVLMITAITLGQIGQENEPPTADAVEAQQRIEAARQRAEEYQTLRGQLAADAAAVRDLEVRVRQGDDAARDEAVRGAAVAQIRAEIARLEGEIKSRQEQTVKLKAERESAAAELARLEPENAALAAKLKLLREQLEKLRMAVAARDGPPLEAQVKIQPSGSGADLKAEFIECAANSIVLHHRDKPVRIAAEQIAGHAEFLTLLDQVKNTPRGTLVFLVRPDGVRTYQSARNVARNRYVTSGKLAIAGQGKLDLSLFGK